MIGRIGQGYDIHRLADGRKYLLGGVLIPFDKGPVSHSDGDVLLHALIDALLGAVALGDIGSWFPDTDPKWKGADSGSLLLDVWSKIKGDGWRLANLDATVFAEAPKLRPQIDEIKRSLGSLLGVDPELCSVKAKTAERLGAIGAGEAVAASVVVLLEKE